MRTFSPIFIPEFSEEDNQPVELPSQKANGVFPAGGWNGRDGEDTQRLKVHSDFCHHADFAAVMHYRPLNTQDQ